MSYVEELRDNYAAIRARLYNPARKITDTALPPVCRDVRMAPERKPPRKRRGAHKNLLGIPWMDILNEVAEKHGLPSHALRSKNPGRGKVAEKLGAAKNELYYRMRTETDMSCNQIGRLLGRDHSTVSKGADTFRKRNGL